MENFSNFAVQMGSMSLAATGMRTEWMRTCGIGNREPNIFKDEKDCYNFIVQYFNIEYHGTGQNRADCRA